MQFLGRGTPIALMLMIGGLLCGIGWALSSPVASSPDDTFHLPSIWCAAGNDDPQNCKELGTDDYGNRAVMVPPLIHNGICWVPDVTVSAACQRNIPNEYQPVNTVNNGTYPPGYYRTMNLFVGKDVRKSVVVMRTVNVALAMLLIGVIALASTPAVTRAMAYSLAVVLVPLGWFVTASINPSSWALTGLTGFGFAYHAMFSAPTRRRRLILAITALVGFAMAINARGDAGAYTVLISFAVSFLHLPELKKRWRLLAVPVVACLISAAFLLTSSQVASIAGAAAETENPATKVIVYNALEWPNLISGMFGASFGLGWLDTPVHPITAFTMPCAFGFVVLGGLRQLSWRKAIALLSIAGPMLALPLMTLYRTRLFVGAGIQPRYLLPLMPILLGLLWTQAKRPNRTMRLSRAQAVFLWLAVGAAQFGALYVNTRRYVTGLDGPLVINKVEWWWEFGPGPVPVIMLASLGFMAFTAPMVLLSGRPPRPNDRLTRVEPDPLADTGELTHGVPQSR